MLCFFFWGVIGVYTFCDGPRLSRGPYLAIATVCSAASLVFVSLKASYVFMISSYNSDESKGGYARAMEAALFVSSLALAIGHVAVAYRTSCRERRKLLVYKIDIEAVSQTHLPLLLLPPSVFSPEHTFLVRGGAFSSFTTWNFKLKYSCNFLYVLLLY